MAAQAWLAMGWCASNPLSTRQYQTLFERTRNLVPWLSGYEKSAPVWIGNDASQQLQFDIYGEMADLIFQTLKAGMALPQRARELRPVVLDYLATTWHQPDEGIWEVRGRANSRELPVALPPAAE